MPTCRLLFWNVSNLFEVGAAERGPTSEAELGQRIRQLATILNQQDANIIGLAEIQSERVLEQLLGALSKPFYYVWEDGPIPGAPAGTGLAVLIDPSMVDSIRRVDAFRPTVGSRPRVLVTELKLTSGGEFLLAVNHWKSRMIAQGGIDPEVDRAETAEWLGELLATYTRSDCAIVVGDFNAEPWEAPFGELKLRAMRTFSGALWGQATPAYLYNSAWRFCAEPMLWQDVLAMGRDYREPRPKTTHDSSPPALFDQLLVSSAVLKNGPITLLEKSIQYVAIEHQTAYYTRAGVLRPRRWSWDPLTSTGIGASDHFPLRADFEY